MGRKNELSFLNYLSLFKEVPPPTVPKPLVVENFVGVSARAQRILRREQASENIKSALLLQTKARGRNKSNVVANEEWEDIEDESDN